jgi:hypothetical protein
MFEEDALEAFCEMDFDHGSIELDMGYITTVPKMPYASGRNVFVNYFDGLDGYSDLDEDLQEIVENMEMPEDEASEILFDSQHRKVMTSLISERGYWVDIKDVAWLSGCDPTHSIRIMEDKDMLETKDSEEEFYRLEKDSDAFWFHALSEKICEKEGIQVTDYVPAGHEIASGYGTWDYIVPDESE